MREVEAHLGSPLSAHPYLALDRVEHVFYYIVAREGRYAEILHDPHV